MISWKTKARKFALNTLYYSQLYRTLPAWQGRGIIFTLHRVVPHKSQEQFLPNGILDVETNFLERTIVQIKQAGLDIVTLNQAIHRLGDENDKRRFVCFTFDDGYVDNYLYALPIFARQGVPFTVYVTTGLIDRVAILWWILLERMLNSSNKIRLHLQDGIRDFSLTTPREKHHAFNRIYWYLRGLSHADRYSTLHALMPNLESDGHTLCNEVGMSWQHLHEMIDSGLVTIGAHTKNHYALSELSESEVVHEIEESRCILENQLGHSPEHFAYPYGDSKSASVREFDIVREMGFRSATTTRKGLLFDDHNKYLTALPRVSLNGDYQSKRFVEVYLSGAPFAISNRFSRTDCS